MSARYTTREGPDGAMKWSKESPPVDAAHLMMRCSSFPPFVWELQERAYPNRLLAASCDLDAIRAVVRLHMEE